MNKSVMGVAALMGVFATVGCVSVESLRQQVNSSNKEDVAAAEMKIMTIVENRNNFTKPEEYIALLKNNDLLLQLVVDHRYRAGYDIANAALEGVLFKNEEDAIGFVRRNRNAVRDGIALQMFKKALDKVSSDEGLQSIYSLMADQKVKDKFHYLIGKKLVRVTTNEKILCEVIDDTWYNFEDRSLAMSRITNEKLLAKYYEKNVLRDVILTKVNEEKIKQIIKQEKIEHALKNDITELEDDRMYFTAFKSAIKDADDAKKESLFERACQIKNEDLLVEFLTAYPDQAKEVAVNHYYNLKNSKLAELILDNLTGLSLVGSSGWVSVPRLDDVVFHAAKALDANTRAKYLKIADENLAAAKQDEDILVVERYYVGMPVIDYVMRSFEENLAWTKGPGAVINYLHGYADKKTDISGKDWRKEWKIKSLVFTAKERQKYFNVKGTLGGLYDFVRKYIDKSAERSDITISDRGWWQYNDDTHGLSVFLNDNSGVLQIDRR